MYLKHQKARKNVSAFSKLITTPALTTLKLPASGRFLLTSRGTTAAGVTLLTIVGNTTRIIKSKGLTANQNQDVDLIEANSVVTVPAGADLKLDCGFGVYKKICGGV